MREPSRIIVGDVLHGLAQLPDGCVHCCVTSPPYHNLRDYGVPGQIGLEPTQYEFICRLVSVCREIWRVLRDDGTFWLNIGGGYKDKSLDMIPWRLAIRLAEDGWLIRSTIVWAKKSPMPESCRDRPTSSWEPIFLLAKSDRYFYDAEAVKEKTLEASLARAEYGFEETARDVDYKDNVLGANKRTRLGLRIGNAGVDTTRNLRNVWHLGPEPYRECHFATFPSEIPRRAIKAGTSEKGCCPKCGAGWVRMVERTLDVHGRKQAIAEGGKCAGGRDSTNASTWGALYPAGSNRSVTLGWSPSCSCNAGEPVPCLVLDPFLGSGTTVAVARELGRHGVGIELNPAYAELARERIGRAEKPQTFRSEREESESLWSNA